jgi:hypothetical protein
LATAIKTGGEMPPDVAVKQPSLRHPWRLGFLSGRALLNAVSRPCPGRLFHPLLSAWAQPCCWRVAPQQSPFPRPAAPQNYGKSAGFRHDRKKKVWKMRKKVGTIIIGLYFCNLQRNNIHSQYNTVPICKGTKFPSMDKTFTSELTFI